MSRRSYRTGDQTLVRSINLSSVLRCLWDDRPLSRTAMATHTGLNKTTVSSLVAELAQRGLIHEVGQRESRGGRPARLLDLNANAGLIVGVEIGVDFVRAILTDLLAEVRWREHRETSPLAGQDDIIQTVLALIGDAVDHAAGSRILGIGVTLRGLVDTSRGVSVFFPNQWRNVPVRQIIAQHFDYPIAVDNDANAAALGERLFGAAGAVDDFIYVVVGMGIGAGICINGQIYRGAGGYAGEVGHTKLLHSNSRPCYCGQRGCWETLANQYALIERVQAALSANQPSQLTGANPLTIERIGEAADAGDPVARQALTETGALVGLGIANLVNTFNPKLVVVGGAMHTIMSYLLPAIRQQVDACSSREMAQMVSIEPSMHGRDACAIGAAALIVQDILHDPASVPRTTSPTQPAERG